MTKQALRRDREFNRGRDCSGIEFVEFIYDWNDLRIMRGIATAVGLSLPVWGLIIHGLAG